MRSWRKTGRIVVPAVVVPLVVAWLAASAYFRLNPLAMNAELSRVAAAPVLAWVYQDDMRAADEIRRTYRIGDPKLLGRDAAESWRQIAAANPDVHLLDTSGAAPVAFDVPFVYESPDAPYLREMDRTFGLQAIAGTGNDEYEAMLRLGAWVGRQFDHGSDQLTGYERQMTPTDVIRAGQNGRKFWCEIAARLVVQAATAMGWQARLISASRTGYRWEHAVAELWSNRYRKWFALDADFNVVYEGRGIPLSVFELCHRGQVLQQAGALTVRRIAPPKRSLSAVDMIPYYAYVHVDLRNDWNSRVLRRGSPVSGDRSTWWTARPSVGPILTAKHRVEDEAVFNWPVNAISLHAREILRGADGSRQLRVGLTAYSPTFRGFEISVDGEAWKPAPSADALVPMSAGAHAIKARVVTPLGYLGPEYEVAFTVTR